MELKYRRLTEATLSGVNQFVDNGTVTQERAYFFDFGTHQFTRSQGNPWPKYRSTSNVGGPFDTVRTSYHSDIPLDGVYDIFNWFWRTYGNILPIWSRAGTLVPGTITEAKAFALAPTLGDTVLKAKGSVAISNCAPTAYHADVMTAGIESIKDGIPKMLGHSLKERSSIARKAGNEYLNVQFGWLPLVSDVRDICRAISDSERILTQLVRDSGKNVRRSYYFGADHSIKSTTYSFGRPWPSPNNYQWATKSPSIVHDKTERRIWFDGCFTYHYDESKLTELSRIATQARILLGLRLTPDVLWNVAPWLWMSDWFVNIGPVLKNITMFKNDGLTLRYGYVMEHTKVYYRERTFGSPAATSPSPPPGRMQCTVLAERKKRVETTPYSLGLVGLGLTLRQAAILSALGVTRGSK